MNDNIFNTKIEKEETDFVPFKEGLYPAYICGLVDNGIITSKFYKDKVTGEAISAHKVTILFVLDAKQSDGYNMLLNKRMTLSFNEKSTLLKFMKDGGFEGQKLSDIIGKPVQVMVKHTVDYNIADKTYLTVDSLNKPNADFKDFDWKLDTIPNFMKKEVVLGAALMSSEDTVPVEIVQVEK
jgi:hypothetical protein